MTDKEHIVKGYEVSIDDMKDKIPPVFKKIGLEQIRAGQEFAMVEMDRASDECDAVHFAVAYGNERHFDARLDNALIEGGLIDKISIDDGQNIFHDAENNVKRISGLLDKWKANCVCRKKGVQPSNYQFAVKRMSDYMDHHGKYDKPRAAFDGFQASLILSYLYDVDKQKALDDISNFRIGKMKKK